MSSDFLTPADVSVETLKGVFDDAFLETSLEGDDLLYVKDGNYGCYVVPSQSGEDIRFVGFATPNDQATEEQRLRFANRANQSYKIVRTYVAENGRLVFDYYVALNPGITKKALILTFKRFVVIPLEILYECDEEGIFD